MRGARTALALALGLALIVPGPSAAAQVTDEDREHCRFTTRYGLDYDTERGFTHDGKTREERYRDCLQGAAERNRRMATAVGGGTTGSGAWQYSFKTISFDGSDIRTNVRRFDSRQACVQSRNNLIREGQAHVAANQHLEPGYLRALRYPAETATPCTGPGGATAGATAAGPSPSASAAGHLNPAGGGVPIPDLRGLDDGQATIAMMTAALSSLTGAEAHEAARLGEAAGTVASLVQSFSGLFSGDPAKEAAARKALEEYRRGVLEQVKNAELWAEDGLVDCVSFQDGRAVPCHAAEASPGEWMEETPEGADAELDWLGAETPDREDLNRPNCSADPRAFTEAERERWRRHCGVEEPPRVPRPAGPRPEAPASAFLEVEPSEDGGSGFHEVENLLDSAGGALDELADRAREKIRTEIIERGQELLRESLSPRMRALFDLRTGPLNPGPAIEMVSDNLTRNGEAILDGRETCVSYEHENEAVWLSSVWTNTPVRQCD